MSESANADNQTFWAGISKLPEDAQRSFWNAGVAFSHYIGEPPTPRTLTYDTSKPPAGAGFWERALFYLGQSSYNQAVSQAAAGEAAVEGGKWLWGALQGDFNKSPTTGQVITAGIISMIPIIDQVCDVRDLVANCLALSDAEAREDSTKWMALGMTCVGFVPEFGSAVKTVAKVGLKEGSRLIDVVKQMEGIETGFQEFKIACPWGRAPLDWLRKYDWVGKFKQAGMSAKKAFVSALEKAQTAIKWTSGQVKAKLQQLADLFEAIIARIVQTMTELGQKMMSKIHELLGSARKETGNYHATPGVAPNKHGQNETPPPKRPNGSGKMELPEVKCFKPGKQLRESWKGDPKKLEKEFYEQLKAQEAGLNNLTVEKYLENRAAYRPDRQGIGQEQERARDRMASKIRASMLKSLARQKITGAKAEALADAKTAQAMSSLAALHDPDMVAGGFDKVQRIGNKNVNSSIGSQWAKGERLTNIDKAAKEAMARYGPDAKMNVKLERCKDN